MAHSAGADSLSGLQEGSRTILDHYQSQVRTRRIYTVVSIVVFLIILCASLDFANGANSGKFFERLPYFFDFMKSFVPDSPLEIFRAMFDLPSPFSDGSIKYDYTSDRVWITDSFYIPNFFYQLAITLNIAIVSTILGASGAFLLCFFASTNLVGAGVTRWVVRRIMEIMRAFPEIVVAGLLAAILSIGPISAIIAVWVHTVGALGKLFFEVVENADMKPDEGLRAAGASWLERVRFAILPQVLPNFVSYTLLRTEINVRASTIIGAVGGGGIGEVFSLSIGRDHAAKTYAIIILLLITVICVDQFSAWLRRRLIGKQSFEFGQGAA
ncbi:MULTISPECIES: phosphonate ABC transporter, permease protein PhnE [Rhizobium]|uniref:Phosphonate ABC transporter, permease protein PhnE n=1 Tax=Rhizobium laguerreae TaxID=1076926 RepID=A0AB35F792_9HYPH|nr:MULTISPECIES: phosphonate ABC transporter, permease protein PhnE [Rhizobium]MBY3062604.1 phosphonate ABC transporter, permease protein PhnE [Rhizobium laguerreae]MBY3072675.1 phosphonate ABC transporter, permease protein PhnE [Rhizobium laguerreae]MBY3077014.1 phosphonate ABC transporter, permease protein PhnE [Rhizobium laguerreae]MBY3090894.1 phosphonate ABC transporter, permease protein PhnE [Rhizobium laguerreae]MBY3105603.1 phosphonate ABC transporter, permease protein PhnE [Rhizobium 